jgi:hypothetical protein
MPSYQRVLWLQGEVVGVSVDVQLGSVSFFVNNIPVVRECDAELAAKKGKGMFASAFPILSPGSARFRPAVHMYNTRPSKLAQVPTMNSNACIYELYLECLTAACR